MTIKKPVVILHGYSDRSQSFEPLARFLKANGFQVVDLWLADYLSMYDELTLYDLGQAMGAALDAEQIPQRPKSFNLIAHSTGGLVVRAYLAHYFYGHPDRCPIQNLLLLAPANFGSPLAALGKSMVGRLFNGWHWDHFFQTGTRILQALELASPISWDLARADLFNPDNPLFKAGNIYTTVLMGSESYGGLKELAHENGSDGTVRVSTANLNARYFRLSFQGAGQRTLQEIPPQYDPIAFGVLYGFNHGTIINPAHEGNREASPLGKLILDSLTLRGKTAYQDHLGKLKTLTRETFRKGQSSQQSDSYHEYQNLTVRVCDQYGEMIPDYFLEFFEEEDPDDKIMKQIQSEILERVRVYSGDSSHRSFLFDITDLRKKVLSAGHRVDMSIAVAAKSERIFYRNPEEYITLASPSDDKYVMPNATLFLDVLVDRAQKPDVFKLSKV